MKQIIIALMFCSIAFAGDNFDGLKSEKKDGVIVIDFAPTADRAKMKREAEASGRRAKQVRSKRRVETPKVRASRPRSSKSYKSSGSSSSYRRETEAERKGKRSKRILREIEQEERDHVGGYSSYEMEQIKKRKSYHKHIVKDTQEHPEDY